MNINGMASQDITKWVLTAVPAIFRWLPCYSVQRRDSLTILHTCTFVAQPVHRSFLSANPPFFWTLFCDNAPPFLVHNVFHVSAACHVSVVSVVQGKGTCFLLFWIVDID